MARRTNRQHADPRRSHSRAGALLRGSAVSAAASLVLVEALESRTLLAADVVKDINPATTTIGMPSRLTDINGTLYFIAQYKLWKSDGTAAGTTQVTNNVWDPSQLTDANGTIYFVSGASLWKTDGTEAGTAQVSPTAMNPRNLTAVGNRVFFRGADGGGDEIWTSDGTPAGTVRLKDIKSGAAGSDPRGLTDVNGKLFFRADDGAAGEELWTSDGTPGGTARVKDINSGAAGSGPTTLTNIDGTLYFTATDGAAGYELWKSDGTGAGTVMVKDIRAGAGGSTPVMLQNVNGKLIFLANDGATGFEIWQSDGTPAGTTLVKDIIPGSASPNINNLTAVGETLFFTAEDNFGYELWKTDGTAAGTQRVKDIADGPTPSHPGLLTAVADRVYFIANDNVNGQELWSSNGTAVGTTLAKDIYPGGGWSSLQLLTASGGRLFFVAYDGTSHALWKSDGTNAGTSLVLRVPIVEVMGSGVNNGVDVNGTIFFAANDGVHGQELWKSDGTSAGTVMVADINPGAGSTGFARMTNINGTLFFSANDRLWKSDGTAAGTVSLSNIVSSPTFITAVGSICYFVGYSSPGGWTLWKSNGSPAGTVLVKDIHPTDANIPPESLCDVNGTLMFVASDGAHGYELWKSDGTDAGTVMVKDIIAGSTSSGPYLLTNVNGTLFFRATDGASGYELWKSDGTDAGTVMIKDIRPGAGNSIIQTLVNVNGTLFFQADDGVHGQEVWKSDGTAGGTVMVRDVYPGVHGSSPSQLTAAGGTLFFRGDDGVNGDELWKTDGTEAGTVAIKDIWPGATGSGASRMTSHNGVVAFAANNGTNWYQIWRSDGTPAGTYPIHWTLQWDPVASGDYLLFHGPGEGGDELQRINVVTSTVSAAALSSIGAGAPADKKIPTTNPAGAMPDSTPDSTPDTFYSAITVADTPNLAAYGMPTSKISYVDHWASGFDQDIADESAVRRLAQAMAAANVPVALDIEHWPIDVRFASEGHVAWSVDKLGQILDWMHAERPDVRASFTGLFPHGNYPTPAPGTDAYAKWQASNDYIAPLVAKVDFLNPAIPTLHPRMNEWIGYARGILTEGARFNKPMYSFLWMRHDLFDGNVAVRLVPPAFWRAELDVAAELSDGVTLWDGVASWTDDTPWYTIMRDFVQNPAPLPPAIATNLSATASATTTRIDVAWQDNAYNETGYRIERRAQGELAFATIATLAAGANSFADTTATPDVQYNYRVVAVNSGGDAPASNEAFASIKALRGRWRFDEMGGATASDSSGAGRNGALFGGATWTTGKVSGAMSFDGVDDRVVVPDAADLRFVANQDFSVSAWVNLTNLPDKRSAIITKSRASGAWYGIGIDAANNWIITSPAGDVVGSPAATGWTHLALVQDGVGGTRRLYVNGVQVASGAAQAGDGTGALWFGGAEGVPEYFAGKIDDVRIYRRALPGAYVENLATEFIVLAGDNAADAWTVRLSADGANYEFFDFIVTAPGATPSFTRPRDTVASINVIGGGGDDQLLIDFSHGDPFPDYGFSFDGGGGDDTLLARAGVSVDEFQIDAANLWRNNNIFVNANIEALSLAVGIYYFANDVDGLALSFDNAAAYFDSPQHVASLQLLGASHVVVGQSGTNTIVSGALSIDAASQFDIADNDLIIHYDIASPLGFWNGTQYTGVSGMLQSGRNEGTWNGNGITTSMSDAGDGVMRTLGIGEASAVLFLGASETALFDGETVDATTIIVKYTYAGDIDLNGEINGDDYFHLDSNVLLSGVVFDYTNGDINLDGELNGDDYFFLDSNILAQGPPL